jgi:hypothetical protein
VNQPAAPPYHPTMHLPCRSRRVLILPALAASLTWPSFAAEPAEPCCPLGDAAGAMVLAATTQPTGEAEPPTTTVPTRPATAVPRLAVHDPELDALLERIDAAAADLDTLDAALIYDTEQGLLGDVQRRTGRLIYDRGQDGPTAADDAAAQRMAVVLKVRVIDGRGRALDQRYVYDGRHWVEIDGDEKRWTRHPASEAEGGGPGDHPVTEMLPSNFDRDALLRKYHVERRVLPGQADGAAPTIRLRPRTPGGAFDHADVTFDQAGTPVTIEMIDGEKLTRITLKNVTRNGAIDRALLDASKPTEPGWSIEDRATP